MNKRFCLDGMYLFWYAFIFIVNNVLKTVYIKKDIYLLLGEYQIYFIECVENSNNFTSAYHE